MSEYQRQRKEKPPVDAAVAQLPEPTRGAAADFVAFLRENHMSPQWGSTNSWNVSHKSRRVCIIKVQQDAWQIWLNTQYNGAFDARFDEAPETWRAYLRERIPSCYGCGSCKPGLTRAILGELQEGACINPVIRMENPEGEMLGLARELVLLRKEAIAAGESPKATYTAMSKRT